MLLFNKSTPSKDKEKDTFTVLDMSDNKTKTLGEKEYLYGALLSELTENIHIEAVKAQSIATYTYAVKMRDTQAKNSDPNLQGAHFKVDIANKIGYITEKDAKEKFRGDFKEISKNIKTAIDETYKSIITFNGEVIVASYHTLNSGITESSENVWGNSVPYLVPVESIGDTKHNEYMVEKRIPQNDLKKILTDNFSDIQLQTDPSTWLSITKHSPSKSVISMTIGDKTITGREARRIFSLRSIAFTVQPLNGDFIFTTYGLGYGVGLSQIGASHLANEGKNYIDILKHYYPSTEVKQL